MNKQSELLKKMFEIQSHIVLLSEPYGKDKDRYKNAMLRLSRTAKDIALNLE